MRDILKVLGFVLSNRQVVLEILHGLSGVAEVFDDDFSVTVQAVKGTGSLAMSWNDNDGKKKSIAQKLPDEYLGHLRAIANLL